MKRLAKVRAEIKVVNSSPKLGTGKVNHRELARLLCEGKTAQAVTH